MRRFSTALLFLCLASAAFAQAPSDVGEWGPVFKWPVVAIHAHLLPDGRVLSWERKDDVLTTTAWLWDPKHPATFHRATNRFASLFCSGHTHLTDGTILVAGGHHFRDGFGEKTTNFFDWRVNTWSKGPDMNKGRWYPTATMLRNGDVVIVSGSALGADEAQPNTLPQVFEAATRTLRDLTGAIRTLDLYPRMILAPDGPVFMACPQPQTLFLDTAGTGSWTNGPVTNDGYRDYGSAVEYEPGKILLVGGGAPTATAETIDLNAASPRWTPTDPMHFARRQLNATILPDGKVLVIGGTSAPGFNNATGSVFEAEMWDPQTGHWTVLAKMKVRRLYHSTAVLLPDGRVLSAGGGMPPGDGGDVDHRDAQLYKPPYFFRGAGPRITYAPERVTYGEEFRVSSAEAAYIKDVTWIRLGSVTHAFNMSQHFNRLKFNVSGDYLNVTAPSNAECPPGPYMLFILNEKGVPSAAKVVFIK